MHLRRALLLFALVLGLTALAASIAPSPRSGSSPPPAPASVAPTPGAPVGGVQIAWKLPHRGVRAPVRRVAPGTHVVLTVASPVAGQASIPRLGRAASLTASTPARFDLLAPPGGRFDVLFQPAAGAPVLAGTIVAAP